MIEKSTRIREQMAKKRFIFLSGCMMAKASSPRSTSSTMSTAPTETMPHLLHDAASLGGGTLSIPVLTLFSLLIALTEAPDLGWSDPRVWGLLYNFGCGVLQDTAKTAKEARCRRGKGPGF